MPILSIFLAASVAAQGGFGGGPGGGMSFGGGTNTGSGSSSGSSMGTTATNDAIIQYDTETDSIIVLTDDKTNVQIAKVIAAMDRPVPQVLINVLFLEVTHTKDLFLGTEASYSFGTDSTLDKISTKFSTDKTDGGFYTITGNRLSATVQALASADKTNVLSRPSILARNNEVATITVGEEIPFITNSRVTSDGQTINTVTYEDIGIILEVTPHITNTGLVQMAVSPEITGRTAETVTISDTVKTPVISKRSAETSIVAADGQTTVIGGLMKDNTIDSTSHVPWLGNIPIIGWLFKQIDNSNTKTELLIFLTPHIINTPDQAVAMTVTENNRSELAPKSFSPSQQKKFIDTIAPGSTPWKAKP